MATHITHEDFEQQFNIFAKQCPSIRNILKSIVIDKLNIPLENNNDIIEIISKIEFGINNKNNNINVLEHNLQNELQKIKNYIYNIDQIEKEYSDQFDCIKNNTLAYINDPENICNICMTYYKNRTLKCKHKICNLCNFKLIIKKCPYCREPL